MSFSIGIIGLPNVGKSTLFNCLTKETKAKIAPHPFTTIDKNIGGAVVPDDLLYRLAKLENISKTTSVTVTFVDIAGLIKGAHQGEGLGNQFLHHIREVGLILHLVRFFHGDDIPHVHNQIDPEVDIAVVNEELLLADLETIRRKLKKEKITEKDLEKIEQKMKNTDKIKENAGWLILKYGMPCIENRVTTGRMTEQQKNTLLKKFYLGHEFTREELKPFHVIPKPLKTETHISDRLWLCDRLKAWTEKDFLHLAPSDEFYV